MTDRDNITLPREVVEGALEALDSEHPDIQLRAAIALRTHLAAEPTKPEPVAAQHRFRLTLPAAHWARKIGSPDWGPWHACKVSNRPAWEIDSQGWEVEYRPLYTAPPQRKPLTEEEIKDCETQAMVNGALPFEQRVFFARAIERAHGIGGEA